MKFLLLHISFEKRLSRLIEKLEKALRQSQDDDFRVVLFSTGSILHLRNQTKITEFRKRDESELTESLLTLSEKFNNTFIVAPIVLKRGKVIRAFSLVVSPNNVKRIESPYYALMNGRHKVETEPLDLGSIKVSIIIDGDIYLPELSVMHMINSKRRILLFFPGIGLNYESRIKMFEARVLENKAPGILVGGIINVGHDILVETPSMILDCSGKILQVISNRESLAIVKAEDLVSAECNQNLIDSASRRKFILYNIL